MRVLLSTSRIDINANGMGDPPICQAVERGQLETVRLLIQQGRRLQINQKTIRNHGTALCIAAQEGNPEMAQALLRHDQIDPNLEN
jgi:ankyrin repeat protein